MCIDALSEKNHYLSPYNFADGNPVFFADPTGLDSESKFQFDYLGRAKYDSNGMYLAPHERGAADMDMANYLLKGGGSDFGGGGPNFSNEDGINVVVLPANIPADDEAMNNIMSSALKHLDKEVLVLFVKNIEDLVQQLKDNNVKLINTLINCSHGNYDSNALKLGSLPLYNKEGFKKLGEALKPFVNGNTNIVLHACNSGGGKDLKKSERNMKALGDASGASVFGLMTWGKGSSSLFNNGKGAYDCIPKESENAYNSGKMPNAGYLNMYKVYHAPTSSCTGSFSIIQNNIRYQTNGSIKY